MMTDECNNCFHIQLVDGEKNSHDHKWNDISELKTVKKDDIVMQAYVCNHVKTLEVNHEGIIHKIVYNEDEQAYYAIRARVILSKDSSSPIIVGRILGKIKDGEVVEEYLLDGKEIVKTK